MEKSARFFGETAPGGERANQKELQRACRPRQIQVPTTNAIVDSETYARAPKRKRAEVNTEDAEAFDFPELLPEMKGEVVERLPELSRALLALTNKENLAKYGRYRKRTLTLLCLATAAGMPDHFRDLESEFRYPFVDDPLEILTVAAKHDRPEFVRAFLQDRPYVSSALRQNANAVDKLLDNMGRYASWNTITPILALVDLQKEIRTDDDVRPLPPSPPPHLFRQSDQVILYSESVYAALRRVLLAAVMYSNLPLLRDLKKNCGNFLANREEKERRNALLSALASCRRRTVELVCELFGLSTALADRRFVVLPQDAPQIEIDYLYYMKSLRCSPSASAVVCNALTYKDEKLFTFAVGEVGCKLRDLERALVSFEGPQHEPLFRRLFANRAYFANEQPLQRLKGGVSQEGVAFFLEKGLLDPLHLRRASSKTKPAILFLLYEKGFPLQFLALLNCVVRHDDKAALLRLIDHADMPRGRSLFALLIRYNATRIIPTLLDRGLFSIPEAIQQTVHTMGAPNLTLAHPHSVASGSGLRQLYASLRFLLFRAAHPRPPSPLNSVAAIEPPVFPPCIATEWFHPRNDGLTSTVPVVPVPRALPPPPPPSPPHPLPIPVSTAAASTTLEPALSAERPPFSVSNVLLSLSSLRLGESPFQAHIVEQIYALLLDPNIPHLSLTPYTLEQCVQQAIANNQPPQLLSLLQAACARVRDVRARLMVKSAPNVPRLFSFHHH